MSSTAEVTKLPVQYGNIFSGLRIIAKVTTLHDEEQHVELKKLILDATPGQVQFTNSLGETYVLNQTESNVFLSLPDGDYTGDPDVVKVFNSYNYG